MLIKEKVVAFVNAFKLDGVFNGTGIYIIKALGYVKAGGVVGFTE